MLEVRSVPRCFLLDDEFGIWDTEKNCFVETPHGGIYTRDSIQSAEHLLFGLERRKEKEGK